MEIYKIVSTSQQSVAALLATISAGEPLIVNSEFERIDLNSLVTGDNDMALLVRVNGESMSDLICSGDWVLIDRGRQPLPNDVVLARLGDSFTLKRHVPNWHGKVGLYLVPSNDLFSAREVTDRDDFEIVGTVRWILRQM